MRASRIVKLPLAAAVFVTCWAAGSDAGVALDALGQFLTGKGYGGAQLVHPDNFYRLPINSNGKAGDLMVDTGASTSVIFRGSLAKLGLTESKTEHSVGGAFGKGRDRVGLTTVRSFTMGNCALFNVPMAVVADYGGSGIFRQYGTSDGLFGIREMVKYGAVLDLGHRLLFVHPDGSNKNIADNIRAILIARGYTPIALRLPRSHVMVAGAVNGFPCRFIVDTGAFITHIDRQTALAAKIGGAPTGIVSRGLGNQSREVRAATFPSLKIGDYEIKDASAAVVAMGSEMLRQGTGPPTAGLLGADYLGRNSAIFDFNGRVLYLRPRK